MLFGPEVAFGLYILILYQNLSRLTKLHTSVLILPQIKKKIVHASFNRAKNGVTAKMLFSIFVYERGLHFAHHCSTVVLNC